MTRRNDAPLATLVSMLRQGVFLIPLLYVMNAFFAVKGNILAHLTADIAAAAIAVVLALRQYRILSKGTKSAELQASHALLEKQEECMGG